MALAEDPLPDGWVCLDGVTTTPTAPEVRIVSSSTSQIELAISIPGMLCETVEHDTTEYKQLSLPTYFHTLEEGAPALPAVRQMLAVPKGCQVSISAIGQRTVTFSGCTVYPVEAEVTRYTDDGWSYIDTEFYLDQQAYGRSGSYPSPTVSAATPGSFRGQGVVEIACYPMTFDPTLSEVTVCPEMLVTVEVAGGSGGQSKEIGPFTSIAQTLFLGYAGIDRGGSRAAADTGRWGVYESISTCADSMTDYLMIVESSLMGSSWIDVLAEHRSTFNGWNVAIVPDTVVADRDPHNGVMSDQAIYDFIQALYNPTGAGSAEHMLDGRLGYVLLVGDARDEAHGGLNSLLPAHEFLDQGDSLTTDHWYACVDGADTYPDLMIGRLCASDVTELGREVQKFVGYEVSAADTQSWRHEMLLTSGFCTDNDPAKVAATHAAYDAVQARLPLEWFPAEEAHADTQLGVCGVQQAAVRGISVGRVNTGVHVVEMCAHGDIHECHALEDNDVGDLTNDAADWPVWVAYSCMTGAYDAYNTDGSNYDCLGEALMHEHATANGPTGALCYFGSSEDSPDVWQTLGIYVWEGLFGGRHRIGDFITFGKMKAIARSGLDRSAVMYNLLGDPAIDIIMTDTAASGYSSAPDYSVNEIGLAVDPQYPCAGSTADFSARIDNLSNYDPDGDVRVFFVISEEDGGSPDTVDWADVQPASWDTLMVRGAWEIPTSLAEVGHRLLNVSVVPLTGPPELRTDNNVATMSLGIEFPGSDPPRDLQGLDGTSVTVADVDGALPLEIIAGVKTPGRVTVFSANGDSLRCYDAPNGHALRGPPAVADLDGDGSPEIVVCYGDYVDALDGATATSTWASPLSVDGLCSAAVIGDFETGDAGSLEVIVDVSNYISSSDQGQLVAIGTQGSQLWESAVVLNARPKTWESTAACADLDSDGTPDALWVARCGLTDSLKVVAGADASPMWSAGVPTALGAPSVSPVVAEFEGTEAGPEVVCGGQAVHMFRADGRELGARCPVVGCVTGIAIADVDDDHPPEILVVSAGTDMNPSAECGKMYLLSWSGGSFARRDSVSLGDYRPSGQPVTGDLDGEGGIEVVAASSRHHMVDELEDIERDMTHLDIFTATSSSLCRFTEVDRPLFCWGSTEATPALADADGDSCLELWFADGEGMLHRYDFDDLELSGEPSRWSMFQRDARHTGTCETHLSGAYPDSSTVSWWGDYLMTGDATIDATSSLLMQPGTTVRVADTDDQSGGADTTVVELIVQGRVTAPADTAYYPVRFALESSSRATIDWYGLRLLTGSVGRFEGCIIEDAYIGIAATQPDTLHVEGCQITGGVGTGVKCTGSPLGCGDIVIRGNEIADAHTGVHLDWCNATVDSNTITDCGSYGIRLVHDYESDVIDNTVLFPLTGSPFAGIRVYGTLNARHETLRIFGNTITNAGNSGIICENQSMGSVVLVRDNTITDEHNPAVAKGISFYESDAVPRDNCMDGVQDGFWIELSELVGPPNLGITMGDGGYNCVDGPLLRFGVRADPYCLTTVRAEGNWWGTANPDSSMFMGVVDWQPFLVDDYPCELVGRGSGTLSEGDMVAAPFCLVQNTPNPFNPITSLRFGLPAEQHVTLVVYNIAGRRVRTLVDGRLGPGWHDVVWDGRDDAHRQVASGVYFCRLESQGSTSVKKVVLLK